jgi:threonine/homoserine/homoserine lactone efflux protein
VIPIWSFLAVTIPLVLTPGASTAVVLRNSIAGGIRAGLETAVGINAGSLCYGLLSAFGVALLLRRWPSLWTTLRMGGVAYLAWLGWRSVRRGLSGEFTAPVLVEHAREGATARNLYEGLITNLLNPAIATFYIVLVPQFVPGDVPAAKGILLLTIVHISVAATWHAAWAIAGGTLSGALTSGRPRQVLEVTAGVALVALAVRMAITA